MWNYIKMPTKEEKHHGSSGSGSSSNSNGNSNGNGNSNSSGGSGTEKQHKYCLLCNRNEFTLESFDSTNEKDLRAIFNIDVIKFLIHIHTQMQSILYVYTFGEAYNLKLTTCAVCLHFIHFRNVDTQMSNGQQIFIVSHLFFYFFLTLSFVIVSSAHHYWLCSHTGVTFTD